MSTAPLPDSDRVLSYRPSAWYYRRRMRESDDVREVRAVGLHVVAEYERLREWVRINGMIPPKWEVDPDEAAEKGW